MLKMVALLLNGSQSFFEMWERSMEEDDARYERPAEMFREAQNIGRWNKPMPFLLDSKIFLKIWRQNNYKKL